MTFFVGCDLGSTTGKVVILDAGRTVLGSAIIKSSKGPKHTFEAALQAAMRDAGLDKELTPEAFAEASQIIMTGYGRKGVDEQNNDISEISCHAKGAVYLNPNVRTIVDIGGQDCKVISVGKGGRVVDFQMNDKCSAGTGRFFEVMSRVLDMSLEDMATEALKSTNPRQISKQCSVFAESEVISLLNTNVPVEDICAGIHDSIARRILGMIMKVGLEEELVLTGGCALNQALRHAIEEKTHVKLGELSLHPQLMGALGAALFAWENAHAQQ